MNYYRINYTVEGEERTSIIAATTIGAAIRNATAVLTYTHGDQYDEYDPKVDADSIHVFPALPGEADEFDHIHSDVQEMERVLEEVQERIAANAALNAAGHTPPYWWEHHDNIVLLAHWMQDQDHGVSDIVLMIEKPWKFTDEYEQAAQEQKELEQS